MNPSKDREHKSVIAKAIFARREHPLYQIVKEMDEITAINEIRKIIFLEIGDGQWERVIGTAPAGRTAGQKKENLPPENRHHGHLGYWWAGIVQAYGTVDKGSNIMPNDVTAQKLLDMTDEISAVLAHSVSHTLPLEALELFTKWLLDSIDKSHDNYRRNLWFKFLDFTRTKAAYFGPDMFVQTIEDQFRFQSNSQRPIEFAAWMADIGDRFRDSSFDTKIMGALWRIATTHKTDENGGVAIKQSRLAKLVNRLVRFQESRIANGSSCLDANSRMLEVITAIEMKTEEILLFAAGIDKLQSNAQNAEWRNALNPLFSGLTVDADLAECSIKSVTLQFHLGHLMLSGLPISEQEQLITQCRDTVLDRLSNWAHFYQMKDFLLVARATLKAPTERGCETEAKEDLTFDRIVRPKKQT